MTRDEVKFILAAYRPNGRDAADSVLGDAIRQADLDPALGVWFGRSQALDAAVAGKLREITPPPGLREAILAGARAGGSSHRSRRSWIVMAGAAAAAVAVLLFATPWRAGRVRSGPAALAQFALEDMAHGRHGGEGETTAELQRRLSLPGAALPGIGAIDFARLRASGCRTLSFAGRDVLEVCFARGTTQFHFYLLERSGSAGRESPPTFLARAAGGAAVWSDRRFEYALVSAAGLDAVRKLL